MERKKEMPKGLKGFQKKNKLGKKFQKEHLFYKGAEKGWIKKQQRLSPKTEFKKGHIPLCKIHPEIMQRGKERYNWKEGKIIEKGGYVHRLFPSHPRANKNGYVYEHILVMEKKMGRPITIIEKTHHIDGDKHNNKPENLFLCKNNREHQKIHFKMMKLVFKLIKEEKVKFNRITKDFEIMVGGTSPA